MSIIIKKNTISMSDAFKLVTYIALGVFIYNSYRSITTYQNPNALSTGSSLLMALTMIFVVFISALCLLFHIRANGLNRAIFFGFLYLLLAVLSTIISGNFSAYHLVFRCVEMGYWICVFTLFYYSVRDNKKINSYYCIYSFAFIGLVLIFVFMSLSENNRTTLLNPVYYLMFAAPIILLNPKKAVRYSGLVLLFIAVLLSYKRSAMISFVCGTIVYLYYEAKVNKKSGKNTLLVLLGMAILICIGFYIFSSVSTLLNLDWSGRFESLKYDGGSGRADIWNNVLHYFFSRDPIRWIFGYGYQATYFLGAAHNDLLEILFDFGFVGLSFYAAFLVYIGKYFFSMKKENYLHYPAFAFSLVLFVFGTMFSQVVIYPYWFIGMVIFWGITIADYDNSKGDKNSESSVALQSHVTQNSSKYIKTSK